MKMIKLIQADKQDAGLLHRLQVEAFMSLYEKYHDDDTSPANESEERVAGRIEDANGEYYIIYETETPIGGIRVVHSQEPGYENVSWISPIFIIPAYQNRGIAQDVLQKIFASYPQTAVWKLSTIKQEKGNCHLYERCGFVKVGTERIVNERMTLIDYERQES